jgi:hypothetical protein
MREKMGNKSWKVFTILIAVVIVASGVTALYSSGDELDSANQLNSKTNNFLSLKEPPFLIASAQEMGAMDTQTCSLEDEAGISAYIHVGYEIDLSKARDAYMSIDTETDEYIIGIVPRGYLEELYPRVYTRIFRRRDFSTSRSELCVSDNTTSCNSRCLQCGWCSIPFPNLL